MTREERNNKLKYLIACMKCEVSGKCCDENCPTQYNAGNMGEIIENLEEISKILEQEPVLDKIRTEIIAEKDFAYADFERYKVEYLGQDWEDALDSFFRYGMERAIELIDKYKAESEDKE